MSSLAAALLARGPATVPTRRALVITGLQNDFVSPDGKLSLSTQPGFVERIQELVPAFREHGIIIWVWTEYRENRTVNDPSGYGCRVHIPEPAAASPNVPGSSRDDVASSTRQSTFRTAGYRGGHDAFIARAMREAAELDLVEDDASSVHAALDDPDLFLSATSTRPACCLPSTWGAEPIPEVADLIKPDDIQITKSYYSAFAETDLLVQLRGKLITDLYFAGCNTNLSIYATATDVARHGLDINLVKDCLGCRNPERHDQAIKQMVAYMGAEVVTSFSVIAKLRGEEVLLEEDYDEEGDEAESSEPFSPVTVRQSLSSFQSSKDPELSGLVASTASDRPSVGSISAPEHAKSPGHEHKATIEGKADTAYGTESKFGTTTALRESGQQRIGKVQSMTGGDQAVNRNEVDSLVRDAWHRPINAAPMTEVHKQYLPPFPSYPSSSSSFQFSGPSRDEMTSLPIRGAEKENDTKEPVPASSTISTQDDAGDRSLPDDPNDELSTARLGSGDSYLVKRLIAEPEASTAFQQLFAEVQWQKMFHATGEVPRLVCIQGEIDSEHGHMPIYRHPTDTILPLLPWTPFVQAVREHVEVLLKHPVNHVLMQLYRDGSDHISEHADKTLDMAIGSSIANVSFGAQRTMRLRTKRGVQDARITERITMPHNSVFVLGPITNQDYLHGIMPDKREARDREQSELAYNGMRISLTFRHIQTFVTHNNELIWGIGATGKTFETAQKTINGDGEESQTLIRAFTIENRTSSEQFDRRMIYGNGIDVLSLKTIIPLPGHENVILYTCGDTYTDNAIKLALAMFWVPYKVVSPPDPITSPLLDASGTSLTPVPSKRTVAFRDVDQLHTIVRGLPDILLHLERRRWCVFRRLTEREAKLAEHDEDILRSPRVTWLVEMIDMMKNDAGTLEAFQHNEVGPICWKDLNSMLRNRADLVKHWQGSEVETRFYSGRNFGIIDCAHFEPIRDFTKKLGTRRELRAAFPLLAAWLRRASRAARALRNRGFVRG